MTADDEDALQAILRHHRELTDGVSSRVASLHGLVAAGEPYQTALADLVAYVADEILTHAVAEEQTLYPAAAATGLAERVEVMVAEHRELEQALEGLARPANGSDAARRSEALASLFATHVATENELILPALLEAKEASLAELLVAMGERYKAAKRGAIGGVNPL